MKTTTYIHSKTKKKFALTDLGYKSLLDEERKLIKPTSKPKVPNVLKEKKNEV